MRYFSAAEVAGSDGEVSDPEAFSESVAVSDALSESPRLSLSLSLPLSEPSGSCGVFYVTVNEALSLSDPSGFLPQPDNTDAHDVSIASASKVTMALFRLLILSSPSVLICFAALSAFYLTITVSSPQRAAKYSISSALAS